MRAECRIFGQCAERYTQSYPQKLGRPLGSVLAAERYPILGTR